MKNGLDSAVRQLLHQGTVIPAHPLALHSDLSMDEERQRLLTRYYLACGAGGLAVAVHTTQFAIRRPEINLLEPVIRVAAEEIERASLNRPFIKIAGICGPGPQALAEARLAAKYGYDLGLLSMGGLDYAEGELIEHARAVADIIPLVGFYLQPAVGGRLLSYAFWRAFSEIGRVHAIKVAAFNRYHTLDVVRAVCDSSRNNEIALYTGNDDHIVADLLTPYRFRANDRQTEKRFVGGLLGQWSVWTSRAVLLLEEIKRCIANNYSGAEELLAGGITLTDINAAIFDATNSFKGCLPGIHELLFRQGLIRGRYCLDPEEKLSPGQMEEIERIMTAYPSCNDDEFVKRFLRADQEQMIRRF